MKMKTLKIAEKDLKKVLSVMRMRHYYLNEQATECLNAGCDAEYWFEKDNEVLDLIRILEEQLYGN